LSDRLCLIGQYSAAGDPLNISGIVPQAQKEIVYVLVCVLAFCLSMFVCVRMCSFIVCLIYLNEKTVAVHHISRAIVWRLNFQERKRGGYPLS
jgi:hypothetical protein